MAPSSGRISVLVSTELQTLLSAVRELPKEVNAVIRLHTKRLSEPIWKEAVRGHVMTRLQTRVLSDTARVAVSDSNVLLRSASAGRTSSGTPASLLAFGAEFGNSPATVVKSRTKKGTPYTRRMGNVNGPPRRGGYVVYPAARLVIPRMVSLWIQTAIRTTHEIFERAGMR